MECAVDAALPSLDAPSRRVMADELATRIAEAIMAGALLPGVRLKEVALAARFGVSRTPVREALRHLEATGLVEKRPHRGMVVTNVDRTRLEALQMTVAERRASQALYRASRMSVRAGDHVGYEAFNADFTRSSMAGRTTTHLAK